MTETTTTERRYPVACSEHVWELTLGEIAYGWSQGTLTAAMHYRHASGEWRPLSELAEPEVKRRAQAAEMRAKLAARKPAPAPVPGMVVGPSGRVLVKAQKSHGVHILLGLFLGGFGAHNFYSGRHAVAVVQLLITVLVGWLILPLLFVWVWAFFEVCFIDTDSEGDPMT